jgi:hypothetical protein
MSLRRVLLVLVVLLGLFAFVVFGGGKTRGPGTVHALRAKRSRAAGPAEPQILFGDLHVHTTYSGDAFLRSLPLLQGEGAHPPADACDFARFCSKLDFFALTDHAESITPKRWAEERETVRRCNAVAGDGEDPDLVVFAGWEWTQVGLTPADHYGHKNVIFRDTAEDRLPARVIAATGPLGGAIRNARPPAATIAFPLLDFEHRTEYLDFVRFQRETAAVPACPAPAFGGGGGERALPAECREEVATPRELFDRLSDWGFEALVIPHGTTWGLYTPPGTDWKKQLSGAQSDPARQFLIEVYSGHGNSEEYRAADAALARDAAGSPICPEPTAAYEPCCWRAGEIIRDRCGAVSKEVCEARVLAARADYLAAGAAAHLTVPGASVEDWRDCGQCRDCFLPAFNYRPGGSVQRILAGSAEPWGIIASSDNHSARPGTGFKEFGRHGNTEAAGPVDETLARRAMPRTPPSDKPRAVDPAHPEVQPWLAVDFERQASFFLTGGLVAVHSVGRSRGAIWDALRRREVYGTSGDRILLWFDLLNGPSGALPMGSQVTLSEAPRFKVRAAGAFVQLPGCEVEPGGPSPERMAALCRGECDRPGDRRKRILRIEVVRIRPAIEEGEVIASLIADPWRTLACPDDSDGCSVEFEDPEFLTSGRDATYYVRAIEERSAAVNGGELRCERDQQGACVRAHPCYGDYQTAASDDCTAPVEERAWSSPIFVRTRGAR